jgi:Na+/H+ antiporter NhaD/arsenite permease-like protein
MGVRITFWDFLRLGAPATLFALGLLTLWCW